MTPAQRRKRIASFKKGKKRPLLRLLILPTVVVLFAAYLLLFSKYYSSKEKLSMVIASPDGSVVVSVLDPKNDEITNIAIPKNTQVEAARQLGTWKIKSIWELGRNEKLGGVLLKDTIIKNFKFPVSVWVDEGGYGFASGDSLGIIKAMFFPYDTNLGMGDRLRIGVFSLSLTNLKRTEIDLTKTAYLKKVKLTDGEEGYVLSGKLPRDLLVVFSDPEISRLGLKVNIKDASGKLGVAQEVAEVIEVMGAKVAAVTKEPKKQSDCRIWGSGFFAKDISRLLSCKLEKEPPRGSFDLEIEIGEGFSGRF